MDTFTHTLSVSIADRLNRYVPREGLEYDKVVLGAEIFLINIPKLILIFSLSALMGVFFEAVLVLIGFNWLRRTAFGLHASNNITCSIVTICMFVIAPFLLRGYVVNNYIIAFTFVGILVALYFYAPADTTARPILGARMRAKLKKRTVTSGLMLFAVVMAIPRSDVRFLLTLGAVYEAVSVLPITYRLLRKSRNNYALYENA